MLNRSYTTQELKAQCQSLGLTYKFLRTAEEGQESLSESYAAQGVDVIFRVSIPSAERTALLMLCTGLLYTPDREHFGIVPIEVIFHPRCLHTFLFLLSIT